MEHHSAVLLRRLNPYCARAMEGAASLCQTRAQALGWNDEEGIGLEFASA